jgi:hypothetical protein
MKAVLHVTVAVSQGSSKWAAQEIDIDFVPKEGMQFDCHAWTHKRKVEDVTYNTATGVFLVDCGVIETANRVEQARVLQVHRENGWETSTDSDAGVRKSPTTCPERETAMSGPGLGAVARSSNGVPGQRHP